MRQPTRLTFFWLLLPFLVFLGLHYVLKGADVLLVTSAKTLSLIGEAHALHGIAGQEILNQALEAARDIQDKVHQHKAFTAILEAVVEIRR